MVDRVVQTVAVQILPAQRGQIVRRDNADVVRIDKPPDLRVIVPGLQIIKPGLRVVVVTLLPYPSFTNIVKRSLLKNNQALL